MIEFGPHLLGAQPSPPDARDFQLAAAPALAAFPTVFVSVPLPLVLTQNGGKCTAFSSAAMKVQDELVDEHKLLNLDADWLYAQQKLIDGIPAEGSTGRAACSVLLKKGIPVRGAPDKPKSAGQHRIAAYYRVPVSEAAFRSTLMDARYGAFILGLPWDEAWFAGATKANGFQLPRPSGRLAGGHEILVVGWDDRTSSSWRGRRGLELQNSWGTRWASKGRAFLPWEFLPLIWEAWRTVDRLTGS